MPAPVAEIGNLEVDGSDLSAGNRQAAGGNRQFSIARFLLLVTLIAAPWAFGAVEPWAWAGLGLTAAITLFLWGLGSVRQGVLRLTWSPLYVPLVLVLVLGLVQYAARLTLDRAETRQALVLLCTDVVLFFVATQLFATATAATWRAFGFTTLLLAGSLGVFAMLQFAAGEQRIYGQVDTPGNLLFGPYVNPNHYAGLMEMLIPVAACYVAGVRPRPSLAIQVWLAVGVAVAIASLLLSGSKGGLLALAAELVIALAVRGWRMHHVERRSLAAPMATAILGTVLLFTWLDPGFVAQKLGLIAKAGGPAWTEWAEFRKTVASDSLHMLRAHPITGVGMGDFETAYPRYQSFPSDLWIDYAHNDYVQALAETGLVGGILMLAALALFLRLAFGARESRLGTRANLRVKDGPVLAEPPPDPWSPVSNPNPEPRAPSPGSWIRLGAALGCCGMLVHSFFDFNLHLPANAAWFAVLAGLATL